MWPRRATRKTKTSERSTLRLLNCQMTSSAHRCPTGLEQIGQVADISFDEDGQPYRLRVRVSAHLGFGERTVELSRDTFILLQGHVVAELSSDELRALPAVGDDIEERRAD